MIDTILVPLKVVGTDVSVPMDVVGDELLPLAIESDSIIPMQFETFISLNPDVDRYEGVYEVTPKAFSDQSLATKDKMMTDDLKVTKVPKYEVSNTSGTTIYIANE